VSNLFQFQEGNWWLGGCFCRHDWLSIQQNPETAGLCRSRLVSGVGKMSDFNCPGTETGKAGPGTSRRRARERRLLYYFKLGLDMEVQEPPNWDVCSVWDVCAFCIFRGLSGPMRSFDVHVDRSCPSQEIFCPPRLVGDTGYCNMFGVFIIASPPFTIPDPLKLLTDNSGSGEALLHHSSRVNILLPA
jgi:hypothetical protein